MDTKKLIEYGVLAIVAYFALTWLAGLAEQGIAAVSSIGNSGGQYYGPASYQGGFIYGGVSSYGSPVRYGPPQRGKGWRGRVPGSGGY